jgi:phosphatidate cytidylyltransferase
MTTNDKILWVFGGTLCFLLLATIIGWLLSKRATSERSKAVIQNLNSRIYAWWWMVLIVGIVVVLGKIAALVLFGCISFLAFREFMTLTPTRQGDYRALFLGFFIIIPVQYYLIGIEWYALFTIFIPVYGFLLLPSLSALADDVDKFLERVAKIQWAVMLAIYCISHAPALLLLHIPNYEGQNVLLLLFLIIVVQMSDVFQYVFGKLFGRIKIAPVVSPSKTVAGFLGGTITAVLLGASLYWLTPFTPWQAAGMSSVIVVMGFLGGLTLSAVKRSINVKDWGSLIEGHGGVLDRMDSICFAAPIFFHLTRYFFT